MGERNVYKKSHDYLESGVILMGGRGVVKTFFEFQAID